MTRACDQRQIRPLFAAMVILSIFIAGSLFTGAPLANALAEEDDFLEYRLENIEVLLEEIKDELDNIHSTYVTAEKLEDEMEIQSLELLREIVAVSSDVDLISIDIKNIEEKMAVSSDVDLMSINIKNIEEKMSENALWVRGTGIGVILMFLGFVFDRGKKYLQSR